ILENLPYFRSQVIIQIAKLDSGYGDHPDFGNINSPGAVHDIAIVHTDLSPSPDHQLVSGAHDVVRSHLNGIEGSKCGGNVFKKILSEDTESASHCTSNKFLELDVGLGRGGSSRSEHQLPLLLQISLIICLFLSRIHVGDSVVVPPLGLQHLL